MTGIGRGVGVTDLLYSQEWPVIALFAIVTQLGDVWFLFLVGGVLYVTGDELPRWGIDRRRGLFVLALVLAYVALIGVLKSTFVLPRPTGAADPPAVRWLPPVIEAVVADVTTAEGPGFPSGHALGSTMVWGGLALVLDRWTPRTRLAVAATVVVVVSLSRLVLGVHFLVDVLVGAGLGIVVLLGLYWLSDRGIDPGRVLLVAVLAGGAGLLIHVTFDAVAAIGGAVGGWLTWRGIADATPAHPSDRREVIVGFLTLGVAAVLFGVVYVREPPLPLTFLGTTLAVGGVVGAPRLGQWLG